MSKTFEGRDWTLREWQPSRLRMDEDFEISDRQVSFVEEVALVATLLGLAAVVLALI